MDDLCQRREHAFALVQAHAALIQVNAGKIGLCLHLRYQNGVTAPGKHSLCDVLHELTERYEEALRFRNLKPSKETANGFIDTLIREARQQ